MGKPLPLNQTPTGAFAPPSGDIANAVLSGTISALGPTQAFPCYGAFNVFMRPFKTTTLTTTAASSAATVASATGLAAGQTIVSDNVPDGTTIGAIAGTNITLAFPPNFTNANVVTGADAAAYFEGPSLAVNATDGTINLERSFDGGNEWVTCGVGGGGTLASYVFGSSNINGAFSFVVAEPEKGILYRLNCIAFPANSPSIKYRFSTNGLAAMSWGVPIG